MPSRRKSGAPSQNNATMIAIRAKRRREATTASPIRASRSTAKHDHQGDPDRQGRGAPGIGDLQRRRGDRQFVAGILVGRPRRSTAEKPAPRRSRRHRAAARRGGGNNADARRHPHVLVAAERDHRSQHREPEKQRRGQFVRPDQRAIEDVARDDATEQNDDLGRHQAGRHELRRSCRAPNRPPRRKRARLPRRALPAAECAGRPPPSRELADRLLEQAPGFVAVFGSSTRCKSRRSAACRGTAPDRAD